MVHHKIPGDVGSLTRLFKFLLGLGLINGDGVAGESAPMFESANCRSRKRKHDLLTPPPSSALLSSSTETVIAELVDDVDPEVIKAAVDAALLKTQDQTEARKAGVLDVMASKVLDKAVEEEVSIESLLVEIVNHRMKKIEKRLSLVNDVDAMLDAQRVALELERRDLFAARCRHWLGD